jgi:hypothetical protein
MNHRHTKPNQFELFAQPESGCPLQTPHWESLPIRARQKITGLMARLLMEHEGDHAAEPGGEVADPLQSRESGDV